LIRYIFVWIIKKTPGIRTEMKLDVNEDYEVRYWTNKWGITADQLKKARANAGSKSVQKIHDAAVALGYMRAKI